MLERKWIRRKVKKGGGSGEQWEVDLTDRGRSSAEGLRAAAEIAAGSNPRSGLLETISGRASTADTAQGRQRWTALHDAIDALEEEEYATLMQAIRTT